MEAFHVVVGAAIVACFASLALWAAFCLIRNTDVDDRFWTLLAVVQITIGVQLVVGGMLFLGGDRPLGAGGPTWLHYVYGALFPAFILAIAHRVGRRTEGVPWVVFGVAAFICFGLTLRALQTGLS